jgi:hypothetical protein
MRRLVLAPFALLAVLPARVAFPDGSVPPPSDGGSIAWTKTIVEAFETGKKDGKPIFIAVNSREVFGNAREPAGIMLRERVYPNPTVVAKSKEFACAMLVADGQSADYGEVRQRFGIDGNIVSPQHIFAYPDGSLIDRREYWPWGEAESVTALVDMMDKALRAAAARKSGASVPPPPPAGAPSADPSKPSDPAASPDAARAEWITKTIEVVRKGGADATAADARDRAITELVKADKNGDCLEPLCAVMLELKRDPLSQVAILKRIGKDQLLIVEPSVATLLDDKNADVRGNAAVTLEYVGDPRAVEALQKQVVRERDEDVKSNLCRALGRCGAHQASVRKSLLHEVDAAKSDRASIGPIIGLAYFEKDADAARAVEKLAAKAPLGGKRSTLLWTLTEIGDPKSAEFVDKEILPAAAKDTKSWLGGAVYKFVMAVVSVLKVPTDEASKGEVFAGVGRSLDWTGFADDAARKGRDGGGFKPKGEFGNSGQRPRGFGPGGTPPPPGMGG